MGEVGRAGGRAVVHAGTYLEREGRKQAYSTLWPLHEAVAFAGPFYTGSYLVAIFFQPPLDRRLHGVPAVLNEKQSP